MLTTADDVFDRARTRIGKLARRAERDLLTPSEADEDALTLYLEDGITTICTETDRMATSVEIDLVEGQEYVERPPYINRIDRASLLGTGQGALLVERKDGRELAQWSRDPEAKTGLPEFIGAFDGRYYLFPVPDGAYTLDLLVTYNGAVGDSAPSTVQDPPTLDTLVEVLPSDFRKAIVAYVVGRWFEDIGEAEIAQPELGRFVADVEGYEEDPVRQVTSTRDYNILG